MDILSFFLIIVTLITLQELFKSFLLCKITGHRLIYLSTFNLRTTEMK